MQAEYGSAKHGLRGSLSSYIASKLTGLGLTDQRILRAIVKATLQGDAFRDHSISPKHNKIFNTWRPAGRLASTLGDVSLEIRCFPGRDYIEHYALLVDLYCQLRGISIQATRVHPDPSECFTQIFTSNLRSMGTVDVVIIGYVERFDQLVTDQWVWGSEDEVPFGWQKTRASDGRLIAFLGCRFSFWGDISQHLVKAVHQLNSVVSVIYVGKAGSLRPLDKPNSIIATGTASFLGKDMIAWDDPLKDMIRALSMPEVVDGVHTTITSPLAEDERWLSEWRGKADWVDCEVGYMARACQDLRIGFTYLHIISDNVMVDDEENLANERLESIQLKRRHLLGQIQILLRKCLRLP